MLQSIFTFNTIVSAELYYMFITRSLCCPQQTEQRKLDRFSLSRIEKVQESLYSRYAECSCGRDKIKNCHLFSDALLLFFTYIYVLPNKNVKSVAFEEDNDLKSYLEAGVIILHVINN